MSARYGDRTRSGDAVSQGGRRVVTGVSGGGAQAMYEETFTAPGTWTWPGNVTHVEVLLVGGGGGSGCDDPPPAPTGYSGGGGGGGVRMVYDIPVSAPVPVTVGAGGTAGTYPGGNGGVGGDSAFGPLSPPIPPSTYKVGGGGGGSAGDSSPPAPADAPPDGGGAGGRSTARTSGSSGGEYGMPTLSNVITNPAVPNALRGSGAGSLTSGSPSFGGLGRWGYGIGGKQQPGETGNQILFGSYGKDPLSTVGSANTGMGGAPNIGAGTNPGQDGSSGVVIVRWWE